MTARLLRTSRAVVRVALATLLVGCAGAGSPPPSPSPAASLTEAAAKLVLFDRFGPLIYCDPDEFPVARDDPATAAKAHMAEMQADPVWPLLAARLGFSATVPPGGDQLLAVYGAWKMVRALVLTPVADGWSFDAIFAGTGPDAVEAGRITRVAGRIGADGAIRDATQEASGHPPCPICLARGTTISTPDGPIPVEMLRPGDPVWTLDRLGRRVAGVIIRIGSMPVPAGHEVVKLALRDGRSVLVSPGHPLVDSRPIADLQPGDDYNGSVVASVERLAYDGGRTYDLLPSGPNGIYWANGIELGSTLFR
jgi:hypothetical protein